MGPSHSILGGTALQLLADRRHRGPERLRPATGSAARAREDRDRDLRRIGYRADRRSASPAWGLWFEPMITADAHPGPRRSAVACLCGLCRASRPVVSSSRAATGEEGNSRGRVIAATLGFTWLNPAVYLDTLVLLGTVASSHPASRWWFGAGAATASVAWFIALGGAAQLLAPILSPSRCGSCLLGGVCGGRDDRYSAADAAALRRAMPLAGTALRIVCPTHRIVCPHPLPSRSRDCSRISDSPNWLGHSRSRPDLTPSLTPSDLRRCESARHVRALLGLHSGRIRHPPRSLGPASKPGMAAR